ncbi:MAG: glutamate-1-semialdehyde 2,1-aminomutase [bacterium]|nr:glutamate-1-semialdehyde 2,1-aminomutase [bacterium]
MSKSTELVKRAEFVIPGGVNSPVRAYRSVGGNPPFICRGEGARIFDVDGNSYIDFVCSWGPLIHGHNHPKIKGAIVRALEDGTSFGAPTEIEVEFAELLTGILPGVEMIRFVSSGTEATMSALRLARGATGRDRVIKFDGCYHGHADSFLVQAGSGVATFGIAGSPGVPNSLAELTISLPYNSLESVEASLGEFGAETFAAIIVEPVAGNMGLVLPEAGFLEGLRKLCDIHGIVLIFDEVMSGFRVAVGGAAERFSVTPDLATYGKVIGGGLPVGAFGGKKELMSFLAPMGPVYQAGTLSGNPLAMAAGKASIELLLEDKSITRLETQGRLLTDALNKFAAESGIEIVSTVCGGMFGFFFSGDRVKSFADAKESNQENFLRFFHGALKRGLYFPPSAYEACFMSSCHDKLVLEEAISTIASIFREDF